MTVRGDAQRALGPVSKRRSPMLRGVGLVAFLGVLASPVSSVPAQDASPVRPAAPRAVMGPLDKAGFTTRYIRLGNDGEGLLFEPTRSSPKSATALVFTHPNSNTFTMPLGAEMAARGYRVLMVNYRGEDFAPEAFPEAYLPPLSRGIGFLRSLPGIARVVLVGHSGGSEVALLYENVAEHGPDACRDAAKIYPCEGAGIEHLARPDGLVVLDSPLGAFHKMSGLDPAAQGPVRDRSIDLFAPANGYDAATQSARYDPRFLTAFHRAQSRANAAIIADAQAKLRAVDAGSTRFSDDEPFVVRGMSATSLGARLYVSDIALAAHTKRPELFVRADGSEAETVVRSARKAEGRPLTAQLRQLRGFNLNTTVRHFLSSDAIRTGPDYRITPDDILGVDWHSAINSPPANAEGVTVPTLVLAMGCHYLIVPDEIIFDHLAANDKSYAVVEGATHVFRPCRPEFGDTTKRVFDFVDRWLSARTRILSAS